VGDSGHSNGSGDDANHHHSRQSKRQTVSFVVASSAAPETTDGHHPQTTTTTTGSAAGGTTTAAGARAIGGSSASGASGGTTGSASSGASASGGGSVPPKKPKPPLFGLAAEEEDDRQTEDLLRLAYGLPGGTAGAAVTVTGPGSGEIATDEGLFTIWERCIVTSYGEALRRTVHASVTEWRAKGHLEVVRELAAVAHRTEREARPMIKFRSFEPSPFVMEVTLASLSYGDKVRCHTSLTAHHSPPTHHHSSPLIV
jgi:hypothetical protein